MWKIWPKRPDIPSELFTELELRGLEAIRAMLSSGQMDLRREAAVFLWSIREPADQPKRYQLEEWVAWKAARQELWVKIGTVAAIAGAVAAIVAAVLAFLAWRFPAITH